MTAPTADFTFSPAAPVAGHAVSFTDASTGYVDSWSWSFGDGSVSTLQSPSHSYALPGTYSVSLTVSNPSGASTPRARTVTVSAQTALRFYTITPCRVADTRNPTGTYGGPAVGAGVSRTFPMTGRCGIPSTAKSVSLNVAVTAPSATGHLTLYPAGTLRPLASTINFSSGQTRANNAVIELGTSGGLTITSGMATGTTHVILDVNGYFQ
jgi:PKD repeat protein